MTEKLPKKNRSTKKPKSRADSPGPARQETQTPIVVSATNPPSDTTTETTFPIFGIGASAGGLEACSELLGQLPADTGMTFVFVQHLDPNHKSMLAELLGRTTEIPIHEVVDGMHVEPNHAYIIPPNTELGILNKTLHLLPRTEKWGPPLPIDYFMQSLAQDQGSMAIDTALTHGDS